MPRIFLLRHAQSTFNVSFDRTGVDPGHIDARLTDLGHEQVRAIAARVHALELDLIVTSPATRALETTVGLVRGVPSHPPILVEALVRDRFTGDSCDYGRPPGEPAAEFPALQFEHIVERWWAPDRGVAGDDSAVESRERFAERIADLRLWLLSRDERSMLLVGHDGTFRVLTGVRMVNYELLEWDPA